MFNVSEPSTEGIAELKSSRPSRSRRPTQSAILEAARRLYAASDYSGVTMRAVAKRVGCRSPSLYHYFKSKDDIFRALVDRGIALFAQFLPTIESADPLEQLWWRLWRYYEFSKAHAEYFRLLFVDRSSPVGDDTLRARVLSGADTHRCIEACVEAGLLPQGTDPRETAAVLWCAIHGAAVLSKRQGPKYDRDLLAARILGLALDGVRAGLLKSPSRLTAGFLGAKGTADGAVAKRPVKDPRRATRPVLVSESEGVARA